MGFYYRILRFVSRLIGLSIVSAVIKELYDASMCLRMVGGVMVLLSKCHIVLLLRTVFLNKVEMRYQLNLDEFLKLGISPNHHTISLFVVVKLNDVRLFSASAKKFHMVYIMFICIIVRL